MIKRAPSYLLLLVLLLCSCTQPGGYIGDIFGKWQLQRVTDNEVERPIENIYYNFQQEMVQLQRVHPEHYSWEIISGRFTQGDDRLTIDMCDEPNDTKMPTYELSSRKSSFVIEKLTYKELIISEGNKRWYLKKY